MKIALVILTILLLQLSSCVESGRESSLSYDMDSVRLEKVFRSQFVGVWTQIDEPYNRRVRFWDNGLIEWGEYSYTFSVMDDKTLRMNWNGMMLIYEYWFVGNMLTIKNKAGTYILKRGEK